MELKLEKYKLIFLASVTFFWFSLYAYIPELSTYAKDLGASYKLIGIITGAYGFTQMLLRIPLGIVSDRLNNRKGFILLGIFVTIVSSMVTFIYPSAYSLLATRLLAGVSAATWVAFTVLFASYFKKDESTKAIGIVNSFNALGQLVAMFIGGFVSFKFGTRYLYLLAALGGLIAFIAAISIRENKVEDKKPMSLREIIVVVRHRKLIVVSILAILSQIVTFGTVFGFVPIVAQNLGANSFQLSMLSVATILPAIIISSASGTFFVKWWGATKTIIIGYTISAVLCIYIPFIPNLVILLIVQLLSGIGRSMVFSLLMGLCILDFEHDKRATAMGFFQAIYGIGMVAGPVILGFVSAKFGLTTGFIVVGIIGLFAVAVTKIFIAENNKK